MASLYSLSAIMGVTYFMAAVELVSGYETTLRENFLLCDISEPTWMYKCVPNKGCMRTRYSQFTRTLNASIQTFRSLDECRIICDPVGAIWPKPQIAILGMHTVKIHPSFVTFVLSDVPAKVRELLTQMTLKVRPDLEAMCGGYVSKMVDTPVIVRIFVKTAVMTLDWNTDEQYTLHVKSMENSVAVKIISGTVFGARHALETFTQLVASDRPDYSDQKECGLLLVSETIIQDHPVYKHRGLLLDCSRHFIPMKDIKRTIRGMAAVKMNVFHWHVTDSHSFPLESARVPQFTKYGAYSPKELYRMEEVSELVQFARIHGIRVVIEIDSPAHVGNGWQWGKDYGLGVLAVCVNAKVWRSYCYQPPCGQLNPANPNIYIILKKLYEDIADLIAEPVLLHMGGDEVTSNCWKSSEEIRTYMTQNGSDISNEGFKKLWAEFHKKALEVWDEVIKATGKPVQPVMIWSSELTEPDKIRDHLSQDRYVIEVVESISSPVLGQLLQFGYRTVSAPWDAWYLEHGFRDKAIYSNWRRMYDHTLPKVKHMLGGEAVMWTEYVDELNLDTVVWPRTAAVAERLWSDPSTPADDAEPRLQRLRGRLTARGLRPDVLSPAWCEQHASWCLASSSTSITKMKNKVYLLVEVKTYILYVFWGHIISMLI